MGETETGELLLPKKIAVKAAALLGNYIPGPGEPDPAFGGTGPYATNPHASPSQAWGQYPQFPPKAPNPYH